MEKIDVKAELLKLRETNPSPEKTNEWLGENAPRILSQIISDISKNITPYMSGLCIPFLLAALSIFLEAARRADPVLAAAADELRSKISFTAVIVSSEMDPEESTCKR